jgi:hypothetical protein
MKSWLNVKTKRALTLLALVLFSVDLYAADPTEKQKKQANQQTKEQTQTQSDLIGEDPGPVYSQMVRQWVDVTRFAKNAAEVAAGKLKLDMQNDPRLQKIVTPAFIADLEQFFYELFISPETIKQLAALYAQYFTLDEMQELINFYKTPLGQKLIKSNSEIMLKSQKIGMNLLRKHQREYMEVVKKYIEPLQPKSSEGTAPPAPVVAPAPAPATKPAQTEIPKKP